MLLNPCCGFRISCARRDELFEGVGINAAVIALGRNGRANGKTRRDAGLPREGNEMSVEVRAVAAARIAGIYRIADSPA